MDDAGLVERIKSAGLGVLDMEPKALKSMLEHLNAICFRDLRLCGCGNPGSALTLVHALLRCHENGRLEEVARQLVGEDGACQIVLGTLDAAGLTEHGTSFWSGWLTPKGKWTLAAMDLLASWDLTDLWDEVFVGLPHNGGDCADACWVRP